MFDERIKSLRLSLGLNQVEFGRRIQVTKQSVCNWENGNILPSVEMLRKIAVEFSVSADYLLGLSQARSVAVQGLTEQEIFHIQAVVNDLRSLHDKNDSGY